jgi:hypothetical protein
MDWKNTTTVIQSTSPLPVIYSSNMNISNFDNSFINPIELIVSTLI